MHGYLCIQEEPVRETALQESSLEAEAMTPKAWKSKVAELGCILCADLGFAGTPANLHHVREGPVSYTHLTLPTNREV